ncbi:MAG: response regulator [Spirochaetota bacterium]|nr:MAG: response regulator [Spirochaetota bacterium]
MEIKALIVDDDEKLQGLLKEYLEGYGLKILSSFDGEGIVELIQRERPDVVILDIMLPKRDGLEILREVRKSLAVPIIMLTARGEDADRIVGLELGADDYLPKPFNPRELLARMKAILRRHHPEPFEIKGAIESGELSLDRARGKLVKGKKEVQLSITELRVMEMLMENPGIVISRDNLLGYARDRNFSAFDRSIDVHISRLRSKLKAVSALPEMIKTVWGLGYMWVEKT